MILENGNLETNLLHFKNKGEIMFKKLVNLINQFNDAGEREDRERPSNAIVLVIYDDGSGFIATTFGAIEYSSISNLRKIPVAQQDEFNNEKEFNEWMEKWNF